MGDAEMTRNNPLRGLGAALRKHSKESRRIHKRLLAEARARAAKNAGKTIATDFDGVAHHYEGWTGPEAKGLPVPGIVEAYERIKELGYRHIVFTTRPRENVIAWLQEHGLMMYVDEVIDGKPMYDVFFDDRARSVKTNANYGLLDELEDWLWEQEP